MKRVLLFLLLLIGQNLSASGLSGLQWTDSLPQSENVYLDEQGCRFIGQIMPSGELELFRVCAPHQPVFVSRIQLPKKLVNTGLSHDVHRIHFFIDEDYPIWLQPQTGLPYPMVNPQPDWEAEFSILMNTLAPSGQHEFREILQSWFGQDSGWFSTVTTAGKYVLAESPVLLLIAADPDFRAILRMMPVANRYNAARNLDHVTGPVDAMRRLTSAFMGQYSAEGLEKTWIPALKEELIFRVIGQWGIYNTMKILLWEGDDWPSQERMLSRASRLLSSSAYAFASIYCSSSRPGWMFFRYLTTGYLLTGILYERYGLAGSLLSHGTFNMLVETMKRFLIDMGTFRVAVSH